MTWPWGDRNPGPDPWGLRVTQSPDGPILVPVLLLDFDGQPFDFLIQGRERNMEAFRRFGLVPAALFQHVDDDPAFAVFHNAKERGPRARVQRRDRVAPAHDVVGQ